jgi:hypothetical protein
MGEPAGILKPPTNHPGSCAGQGTGAGWTIKSGLVFVTGFAAFGTGGAVQRTGNCNFGTSGAEGEGGSGVAPNRVQAGGVPTW